MDTSGQNHLEEVIFALCIFVSPVIGVNLAITASPEFPLESTAASLICHIPSFTGGAEWIKNGSNVTQCRSGSCIPPISARYQYSTNATSITVTIPRIDIAQDETTWTCVHNTGADIGVYNLIAYKIPSILSINGTNSSTLSDSVTVHLSVSTGCIHPFGPEHYNITWKYVEPDSTAEKLFEMGITQNVTSVVGCVNSYEDSLMLNLYITNRMNPGTTTLYISQIKMTFTMAGINVSALLNVTYDVTPVATFTATTSNTLAPSSNGDIKVIVPAVVVPCGLLIIGGILLVVCCVRRRIRKNVRESPDGMAIQDKGNNIEGWKQSQGHGKATDNLDAVYTTPDGFIIYPGSAAMSTARSYKDKKHHGVTDQYNRPYAGPYHHQAEYFPSTYTHKDKKHHGVTDPYSRPSTGTYGYQAAYVPNTYMSARTYAQKGKKYDYEGPIRQQASHQMATSRPAYDQTAYYPQTGHYGQSSQDVYYSGGGHCSYGQRSRSHHDHNGRKQQREYYNQYEMTDYGDNRAGYRHTKQDTAFYN